MHSGTRADETGMTEALPPLSCFTNTALGTRGDNSSRGQMPLFPSGSPPPRFLEDSQEMMWSNSPRSFGNSRIQKAACVARQKESQAQCRNRPHSNSTISRAVQESLPGCSCPAPPRAAAAPSSPVPWHTSQLLWLNSDCKAPSPLDLCLAHQSTGTVLPAQEQGTESASAIADSTPALCGSSALGSACAGSHLYMKTIDGFSLESDLASLNQWCLCTGGGGSMWITVPSRPTNFPLSLSFSLSSSSSAFLRRKKLLNDIQRLGLASGRRPSECRMDSASVDLAKRKDCLTALLRFHPAGRGLFSHCSSVVSSPHSPSATIMVGFTAIVGFLATGGRKLPLLLPRWLLLWFALGFRFPCLGVQTSLLLTQVHREGSADALQVQLQLPTEPMEQEKSGETVRSSSAQFLFTCGCAKEAWMDCNAHAIPAVTKLSLLVGQLLLQHRAGHLFLIMETHLEKHSSRIVVFPFTPRYSTSFSVVSSTISSSQLGNLHFNGLPGAECQL
ncbi:hypothetical protein IHE44_0002647 [Lamprotornis superbus]|uniref:Uncharacterized protein n=1 Tax=Lamprotornis superbus TaxID=245042 RepID=A0A835U2H1_9PASS|nr:hypothetical protein IHE44_0002647 [Lamprotornis superbus]